MKDSFIHAGEGIIWTVKHHRNFRIHILLSIVTLLLAFALKITRIEFIILIFTMLLGLVVEMLNTSIEEITNLITIKWARQAKVAKDVSAGMMLIVSIGAFVIGLIIFTPYFFEAFS